MLWHVQDLCANQEWLDLYFRDHTGIKDKVRQQLAVADVAPSPSGKRDPVASLLTLRARLFRYQHPRKSEHLMGLNTFKMPPKDIIGKSRPLTQVAALIALMRLDFEAAAWPCPTLDVLQICAERLLSLDKSRQLPTGQEVKLVFPDGQEMAPDETTHEHEPYWSSSGTSGAQPATSSSKQPAPASLPKAQPETQRPQSTTGRTAFQFKKPAAATAAAAAGTEAKGPAGKAAGVAAAAASGTEAKGPAGVDNLAASFAAAMHGNGSGPNFSNYVDKNGKKVGMLMPAGGDGQYTPEQCRGWCEAMMEAHATGDTARSLELSHGGPPAFKVANSPSASMPAPASKAASAPASKAASASAGTSRSGQKSHRSDAPRGAAASGLRRAFLDPASQSKSGSQCAAAPEEQESFLEDFFKDDGRIGECRERLRQQAAAVRRSMNTQAAASAQASSSCSSTDQNGMRATGSTFSAAEQLRNQVEQAEQATGEVIGAQAARSAEEAKAVRRAEAEAASRRFEEQAARRAEEAAARQILEVERARRADEIATALLREEEEEQKARQKKIKSKAKKASKAKNQKKASAAASPAAASSLPDLVARDDGMCS